MGWRAHGSLEMDPNIPQVAPGQGEGCMLCTCVSNEGERRLASMLLVLRSQSDLPPAE